MNDLIQFQQYSNTAVLKNGSTEKLQYSKTAVVKNRGTQKQQYATIQCRQDYVQCTLYIAMKSESEWEVGRPR